jgi:hypothetical protein
LTSVTIGNSVTRIGDVAFFGCRGLTYITIPQSVTIIDGNPFTSTPNLEIINVEKGNVHYRNEGNSLIRNYDNTLISGTKNSIIPESVTSIGDAAFMGCIGLTDITIPDSVTHIGRWVFALCSGLTSIVIPNSITTIGDGMFTYCTGLTSIIIPNSVTEIGEVAFEGCSDLTSIFIPNSVTTIGWRAFRHCTQLTIYAEAPNQPAGWLVGWNPDNRPVVWGHVVSDGDITEIVHATILVGNYPNPFNPQTTIRFVIGNTPSTSLPPLYREEFSGHHGYIGNSHVVIDIYNVRGQRVRTLVNGVYSAGSHSVVWNGTDDNGRNVSSGMYFYRMTAGEYSSVRRMMMLK